MTHHVTRHHHDSDAENVPANGKSLGVGVTEEYQCTDEELAGAGFQLRDPEEMPEHESEFASDPWGGDPSLIRPGAGLGELVELLDIDPRPQPRALDAP
jgi:hypothetical protein